MDTRITYLSLVLSKELVIRPGIEVQKFLRMMQIMVRITKPLLWLYDLLP